MHFLAAHPAGQKGVFALEPIAKDETVIVWSGKTVHLDTLGSIPESERDYVYQVRACACVSVCISLCPMSAQHVSLRRGVQWNRGRLLVANGVRACI